MTGTLKAATKLFVKHGFDGTTFARVSQASGAVVGSITHFFGTKAQPAAAVREDVADRLVAGAKTALRGHGTDLEAAIRALLSACVSWDERFPHYRRLISMLEIYALTLDRSRADERQDNLPKVLADWADALARKNVAAPLSPSQLYAVVLAPAMCAATPAVGPASDARAISIDWLTVLTSAAFTALALSRKKPRRPTPASPRGETAQSDLLR